MPISFCTLCKDRLWQLEQTLPVNLKRIRRSDLRSSEIIILDYGSTDGLEDYIKQHYSQELGTGDLRYYKLLSTLPFSIPTGKNIAHRLGIKPVLFNLDADNFIGQHRLRAASLAIGEISILRGSSRVLGLGGRIGLTRDDFYALRGYDEDYFGMAWHDVELKRRAWLSGFTEVIEHYPAPAPIRNSGSDTALNLPEEASYYHRVNKLLFDEKYRTGVMPQINPIGFGQVTVEDDLGQVTVLENTLPILE